MNMCSRGVGRICRIGTFLVVLTGIAASLIDIAGRFVDPSVPEFIAAFRDAARHAGNGAVGVLCENPEDPTPVDRSRAIAALWECAPRDVEPVGLSRAGEWNGVLLATAFLRPDEKDRLRASGYRESHGNEFATVWCRPAAPAGAYQSVPPISRVRDAVGTFVFLAVIASLWCLLRRSEGEFPDYGCVALALVVFVILAAVALSHPLLVPNGLGVYGGKAKVLLAGSVPDGFWSGLGFAWLQPFYPPGLTALMTAAFAFAGGCGDRYVQLLGPFFMALLFLELNGRSCRPMNLVLSLLFVLNPIAVDLATGLYAEPFAALSLVIGWRLVWRGRSTLGWGILGLAGLFRLEGVLCASVAWTALRLFGGRTNARLTGLVLALAPEILWIAFCASVGAAIRGFDFLRLPSATLAFAYCTELFRSVFGGLPFAALVGGLFFLFALCLFAKGQSPGSYRVLLSALVFVLASLIITAVAFGFVTTSHWTWMLARLVPRQLWLYLAPSVCAMIRRAR